MQPKLTIGIPTRKDVGVWYTIHAIGLYHGHLLDQIEVLVVDNSPESSWSRQLEKHCAGLNWVRYLHRPGPGSSCLYKDVVFREGAGRYVLCCDSHVLFEAGSLDRLLAHFDRHPETSDLIMGPCLSATGKIVGTNQMLYAHESYPIPTQARVSHQVVCRGGQLGVWVTDPRGLEPENPPFEIMQQGTGAFACRKAAWPGFHPAFSGFGGNETYLMECFRQRKDRVVCHPGFRWIHCFYRPEGTPYELQLVDRIRNYLVGALTLGRSDLYDATIAHFSLEATSHDVYEAIRSARKIHATGDSSHSASTRINSLPSQSKRLGVYEIYLQIWKVSGGDTGGAVPKPLFVALCHLKQKTRDRPTKSLEFGSGLSTLAFDRQKTMHTAIEHSRQWIERVEPHLRNQTVEVIHAPIDNGWYSWQPPENEKYDVILIDGPPQSIGRKQCIEHVVRHVQPDGVIYVDDTMRTEEQEISAELCRRLGWQARRINHGGRSYDVVKSHS